MKRQEEAPQSTPEGTIPRTPGGPTPGTPGGPTPGTPGGPTPGTPGGSSDCDNLTLAVFKEVCDNRRASVTERLQITAVFGAVLAGFFGLYKAIGGTSGTPVDVGAFLVFMMAFSLLGLLITLKVDLVVKSREAAIEEFLRNDPDGLRRGRLLRLYDRYPEVQLDKISIGLWIPMFFVASLCVLLTLLSESLLSPLSKSPWSKACAWIPAVIVFWQGYSRIRRHQEEVKQALEHI